MFFKDDAGCQVVLFGVGRVGVLKFVMPDFAGIILAEGGKDKIGLKLEDLKGKTQREIGAKVKLAFRDTESVDIMIDSLKKVKKAISNAEVARIITPDRN